MSRIRKQLSHFFCDFRVIFSHGHLYRLSLFVSVLFTVVTFALPLWRIVPLADEQPFIPLHYNVYFGVDRFGPWYDIFILPALALVFLLINIFLQTHFFQSEKVLARIFALSTVFIEIVLAVAMFLIVLLNA